MTIEIKQTPDNSANAVGLNKHGRSKMPDTTEKYQATFGNDGRWVTGMDEDAQSVRSIPDKTIREAEQKRLREMRERIERYTGFNLSATNEDFWGNYLIGAKNVLTLDLANPKDELKYRVLIANRFIADSNNLGGPEFRNTKYYVARSEEEASAKAASRKERDKARAFLFTLSDNKARMTLVARYLLGTVIKDDLSADALYVHLSDYIDEKVDKTGERTRRFLSLEGKRVEDLQYFILAQDAIKFRVVIKVDGAYKRGHSIYVGVQNTEDLASYLAQPDHIQEYDSVREEIAEKMIYA